MHSGASPLPRRFQRGVAAIELTLALPVLLLLMIVTVEGAKLLYDYNTLTKVQRNGARFLASQASVGQVDAVIADTTAPTGYAYQAANLIVYGQPSPGAEPLLTGMTTGNVSFSVPSGRDDLIEVRVIYNYTPVLFNQLPFFGYGDSATLSFPIASAITVKAVNGG